MKKKKLVTGILIGVLAGAAVLASGCNKGNGGGENPSEPPPLKVAIRFPPILPLQMQP